MAGEFAKQRPEATVKAGRIYVPAEGYGAIFDHPRGNPKAPTWQGDLKIGGRLYRVNGWSRMTKSGPMISLRLDAAIARHIPRRERVSADSRETRDVPADYNNPEAWRKRDDPEPF